MSAYRSRSYWRERQRQRELFEAHQIGAPPPPPPQQRPWRPPPVNYLLGPLQDQAPIITFTPQRVAPLYTVVQNDGSLVTSASTSERPVFVPPPTKNVTKPTRAAAIAERAQAILRARPDPDAHLLAELAAGPAGRKRARAEQEDQASSKRARRG
ncbi:hypothetical protein C8R44DRAFT_733193 [Mycena epipterygia]|nr:hypothetical protein C8R44DRAFT_733193 [Mycena epipterygia]